MPVVRTVEGETIGNFLAALAAGTPDPGGGAAAALMGATGAALLSMACELTTGRGQRGEDAAKLAGVRHEADDLRTQALILAAADADAYRNLIAARQLPRDTRAEQAERIARIQESLKGATHTPLRTAALAARVVELASQVVESVNANAIGDLVVGVLAARTSLEASALNAEVNLALIRDASFKDSISEQLRRHLMTKALASEIMRAAETRT